LPANRSPDRAPPRARSIAYIDELDQLCRLAETLGTSLDGRALVNQALEPLLAMTGSTGALVGLALPEDGMLSQTAAVECELAEPVPLTAVASLGDEARGFASRSELPEGMAPALVRADTDPAPGAGIAAADRLAALRPFEIRYRARLFGMTVKATASLVRAAADRYEYRFDAGSVLGRINEVSIFALDGDQGVVPATYAYERGGLGKNQQADLAFDWPSGRVRNLTAKAEWSLDVAPGVLDPLSFQIQLRTDALRGAKSMVYPIAKDGRLRDYRFSVVGEEVTKTQLGPLRTLRLRRDRGGDNPKETTFWLAVDWSYVIVKIRDGKLTLTSGTLTKLAYLLLTPMDAKPVAALAPLADHPNGTEKEDGGSQH